ncbi:hypothetical protein GM661_10050 [Iocasia frigidifontis]|uniref:Tetratricopeptide repeat protein n=2 Tax=Halanaerobiaceae TaxID=972 RepID=A0A8A7KDW6_9FIRM|nr:hypothetical protein [Iocasia fonsfrigidae]QTL98295.1 hypothetical protein GM661_10050 [Iocasia fonsfrigidae]
MALIKKTIFLLLLFCFMITLPINKIYAVEKVDWNRLKEDSLQLVEKEPDNIMAKFRYSIALANLGMIEEALDTFEEIEDTVSIDEFNQVVSPYLEGITLQSEDILSLNYAAFGASINKEYTISIDYFKRIIELEPDNIWIRNYLALVYKEIDNNELAIETCEKALEVKENEHSRLILAVIYYDTGHYIKAFFQANRAGSLVKKLLRDD